VNAYREPPECPGCGRIMSYREADEQGACNDCAALYDYEPDQYVDWSGINPDDPDWER